MNALTTEEFIKRSKEVHNINYDYSLVEYTNNKSKVKIICPKHGIFEQRANNHLRGDGCCKCAQEQRPLTRNGKKRTLTTEEFIKRAEEIHNGKYDYSLVDYKNASTKVKIICLEHGIFEQRACSHLEGRGCPNCVKNKGEEKIENWLIKNNFKYKKFYKFQDLKDERLLSYDFFLPDENILIESNGQQHYKPIGIFDGRKKFLKQKHHDWLKRKYAKDNGYKLLVIPYWNFKNINHILEENLRSNPLR